MRSLEGDSPGKVRTLHAYVSGPGVFPGMTVTKMATGQFSVNFHKPFRDIPGVAVNALNSSGYGITVAYTDSTRATIYTFTSASGPGAGFVDLGFTFTAIGLTR